MRPHAAELARYSTSTLHDGLVRIGLRPVVATGLRAAHGTPGTVAGKARTLRMLPWRDELRSPEQPSLLATFIESTRPGDLLVIDGLGSTDSACLGDLLIARAERLGAAGVVVDGAIRDEDAIRSDGLPVWSRGTSPRASTGWLLAVEIDGAVHCAGAAVTPEDYVAADRDGIVVIPAASIERVVQAAAEIDQRADRIRAAILAGQTLAAATQSPSPP